MALCGYLDEKFRSIYQPPTITIHSRQPKCTHHNLLRTTPHSIIRAIHRNYFVDPGITISTLQPLTLQSHAHYNIISYDANCKHILNKVITEIIMVNSSVT